MRTITCVGLVLFSALGFTQPVYDMRVTIRPADRFLSAEGTIKIPPKQEAQTKLFFQLAKQMQDLNMEIVSPVAQQLSPKLENDNNLGTGNYSVALSTPIPANTETVVKFTYHGGDKTAFVFHIGEEGNYADGTDIAWYPQFGQELDQNGKFGIDAAANILGKVTYTVPSDLTLVASGQRSVGAHDDRTSTFSYAISHPTTFAFSLDKFRVLRSEGRVPVTLYLKDKRPNEPAMLDGIRKIVDELTTVYGTFPYPEFALVEVNDKALEGAGFGGAGCPGFMLSSSSFLDQGFNVAFFGHEISHQWWGNEIVHANEAEGNDLLDEAIAQYGSLLCVRRILGDAAAAQYRWSGNPGYVASQCGRNYLRMTTAGIDLPLAAMPTDQGSLAHEIACEKGFLALEELRRTIGEKDFHRALKNVVSKYAYRSITWKQFKDEVGAVSHQDLAWFWKQWFEQTGAPTLSLTWKHDGPKITGVIDQVAPAYRTSVPVRIDFANGDSKMIQVAIRDLQTPFTIAAKDAVTGIELDPNFEVLHFTPETKAEADAFIPATKAEWIWFSGAGRDKAEQAFQSLLPSIQPPDEAGVEFYSRLDLALMLSRDTKYAEALKQAEAAGQCVVRDPLLMPTYYRLIMTCSDHLGDKAKATWAARAAILTEERLGQHTGVSLAAEKFLAGPSAGS